MLIKFYFISFLFFLNFNQKWTLKTVFLIILMNFKNYNSLNFQLLQCCCCFIKWMFIDSNIHVSLSHSLVMSQSFFFLVVVGGGVFVSCSFFFLSIWKINYFFFFFFFFVLLILERKKNNNNTKKKTQLFEIRKQVS